MQQIKERLYISTILKYIVENSDQLSQAVELLWWTSYELSFHSSFQKHIAVTQLNLSHRQGF